MVMFVQKARVQRIDEQIVEVPIPQITEDIVAPQELLSERICEQIVPFHNLTCS